MNCRAAPRRLASASAAGSARRSGIDALPCTCPCGWRRRHRADQGHADARARLRPARWSGSRSRCWRSGLVMVYSASVALPDNPSLRARYSTTYFLHAPRVFSWPRVRRRAARLPGARWRPGRSAAPWLFVASLLLLVVVLIPHIGTDVNGARRWMSLGFMSFQPSELAKLAVLLYAADYMVRKMDVKERFFRAVLPMARRGGGRRPAAAGRARHGRLHGDRGDRHGHPVPGRRQRAHVLR